MLGIAAVVISAAAALGVLVRLPLIRESGATPSRDRDVLDVVVALGLYPGGALLVTLGWLVASVAVTTIGSLVAYRYLAGERTSLRVAWRQAAPRIPSALGLGVLNVMVILAPGVIAATGAIALAVGIGPEHARLTTTALFALAAILVIAVLPTLMLAGPMLVIEKLRPVDALWRTLALQRRGYWRLLGRVLCTCVLVGVVSTVAGLPFSLAAVAARPGADISSQSLASLLYANVGWVVGQLAVLPFLTATNAQLYSDQVVRSGIAETVVS